MTEPSLVFEVDPQSFQTDVVERSRDLPVLILFWADQVPPSASAKQQLTTLQAQYQNKFALALVDVSRDQTLAQHLRVQGLPSLRVVADGQIVEQADGPQDEAVLRALLDRLTMSSGDLLRGQLDDLLAARDFDSALTVLRQALAEEPGNPEFKVQLADVLIQTGDTEQARSLLATLPEETPGRERPATRLEMMEEVGGFGDFAELEAAVAADPDDLESRYRLAVIQAVDGDYESALVHAMYILEHDRTFREDIGRATMVRIFVLLGKGSELASRYRRRMFNFMH